MLISKKKIEYSYLIFTFLAVFLCDLLIILSSSDIFTLPFGTYLIAVLLYLSIIIFIRIKIKYANNYVSTKFSFLFTFWLCFLIVSILRGLMLANSYWDFKFLFFDSIVFTLVSLVYYVGQNLLFFKKIFDFYLKKVFLFGFVLIPLALVSNRELYARLMIPIGIFILFIPYIKKNWKILVIVVAVASLLVDITFRTNIIKIMLSIGILSLFYFKDFINTFITKLIWLSFFIIPFVLLGLALTGEFNIFEATSDNEEYSTINEEGEIESLSADTRTFLYQEVIIDVVKNDAVIFGKSPSQGYKSFEFYDTGGGINGIRYSCEVNILNIFLYFGLVGVILFFLVVFAISYLGIFKSKNRLSKMLGLLLASRFMLSFLEEFTNFDLNFYFFWLIVGLVSSNSFRNMSDNQIKLWLHYGYSYLKHLEMQLLPKSKETNAKEF